MRQTGFFLEAKSVCRDSISKRKSHRNSKFSGIRAKHTGVWGQRKSEWNIELNFPEGRGTDHSFRGLHKYWWFQTKAKWLERKVNRFSRRNQVIERNTSYNILYVPYGRNLRGLWHLKMFIRIQILYFFYRASYLYLFLISV